jgi:hypothetical protein
MSVRYTATWYDVMQARQPVLPGGRNSSQKAQKGQQKKKFVAEFWLILPKTGRKGAAENFQKVPYFKL